MSEELRHNGRHALAFDCAWSVKIARQWIPRNDQMPQRIVIGGDLYNYGHEPPRYPMPAIRQGESEIGYNDFGVWWYPIQYMIEYFTSETWRELPPRP